MPTATAVQGICGAPLRALAHACEAMADLESYSKEPGKIALAGDLTLAHAGRLCDLLLSALGTVDTLDVDLAQAERLDTAGVQVLLIALREADQRQKTLRLCDPSSDVARVLQLLRLSSIVHADER